jgi:hypothetical protein
VGATITGKHYFECVFQEAVGNSPTKCDFDFGSRCCRLCAVEASQIQKQGKRSCGVHLVYFPLFPIVFFWNLRVEDRTVLTDQFALLLADFLNNPISAR